VNRTVTEYSTFMHGGRSFIKSASRYIIMILMRRVNILMVFKYCAFKIQVNMHGFTSSSSNYVFLPDIQNKFLQIFLILLTRVIRHNNFIFNHSNTNRARRSQRPRGLRRRSAAARLLRTWVQIPPGAWMFFCCECCVLLGRGHCDKLITRPEESYLLWCVVVCDLEYLKNEEAMTGVGSQRHNKILTVFLKIR
jgi:hypothetical protein